MMTSGRRADNRARIRAASARSTSARPSGITCPGKREQMSRPSWPGAPSTTVRMAASSNKNAAGKGDLSPAARDKRGGRLFLLLDRGLVEALDLSCLVLSQTHFGRCSADVQGQRPSHFDRAIGCFDPTSLGVEGHLATIRLVVLDLLNFAALDLERQRFGARIRSRWGVLELYRNINFRRVAGLLRVREVVSVLVAAQRPQAQLHDAAPLVADLLRLLRDHTEAGIRHLLHGLLAQDLVQDLFELLVGGHQLLDEFLASFHLLHAAVLADREHEL